MQCPLCGSNDIREACCGDSTSQCRLCGFHWESWIVTACPLPEVAEEDDDDGYEPLTHEQMWGE